MFCGDKYRQATFNSAEPYAWMEEAKGTSESVFVIGTIVEPASSCSYWEEEVHGGYAAFQHQKMTDALLHQ